MKAKHIVIVIIVLAALSAIPFYFGTRAPQGTPPITPPGAVPAPTSPPPAPAAPSGPVSGPPPASPTPAATPPPASTPPPSGTPTLPPQNQSVSIANFAFPASLTVRRGATVTWTNSDTVPHTVTSDTASVFDSGLMNNGATFSFTFKSAGSFAYHCAFHPSMRGTIVVTE